MANRYIKDNRPQLEKVEKIILPNKNLKQKLIIAAVLLIVGLSSIGYGLYNSIKVNPGYAEIEVGSNYDKNNSKEFTLLSYVNNSIDKRNIAKVYSDAQVKAYRLFNVYEEYEHNLFYINNHPNETIEIDKNLYDALKLASDYRYIFLGPIYQIHNSIFSCDLDGQIIEYLPDKNEDIKNIFDELSKYIMDNNTVNIDFFDNNLIKLNVDNEYLCFLKDNQLDRILDFYYMNNACIMDYICNELISAGYDNSIISSVEGYMRLLDESRFNYNLLGIVDDKLLYAGDIECCGPVSVIEVRNFIINEDDKYNYYKNDDGNIYSKYLDFNGKNITNIDNLLTYSNDSALKLMLDTMDIYFGKNEKVDNILIIGNNITNNTSLNINNLNEPFVVNE